MEKRGVVGKEVQQNVVGGRGRRDGEAWHRDVARASQGGRRGR